MCSRTLPLIFPAKKAIDNYCEEIPIHNPECIFIIPEEVLRMIISYLNKSELIVIANVCKRFLSLTLKDIGIYLKKSTYDTYETYKLIREREKYTLVKTTSTDEIEASKEKQLDTYDEIDVEREYNFDYLSHIALHGDYHDEHLLNNDNDEKVQHEEHEYSECKCFQYNDHSPVNQFLKYSVHDRFINFMIKYKHSREKNRFTTLKISDESISYFLLKGYDNLILWVINMRRKISIESFYQLCFTGKMNLAKFIYESKALFYCHHLSDDEMRKCFIESVKSDNLEMVKWIAEEFTPYEDVRYFDMTYRAIVKVFKYSNSVDVMSYVIDKYGTSIHFDNHILRYIFKKRNVGILKLMFDKYGQEFIKYDNYLVTKILYRFNSLESILFVESITKLYLSRKKLLKYILKKNDVEVLEAKLDIILEEFKLSKVINGARKYNCSTQITEYLKSKIN